MEIIRGTTPTVIIQFAQVDVSDLTKAYLVIRQGNSDKITKTLEEAIVRGNSLYWTLSQEETLGLLSGERGQIMCDWVTDGGVRGRSESATFNTGNPGKEEVL